jgi:hypothetical protein
MWRPAVLPMRDPYLGANNATSEQERTEKMSAKNCGALQPGSMRNNEIDPDDKPYRRQGHELNPSRPVDRHDGHLSRK